MPHRILNMTPIELQIRTKNQAEKKQVLAEIRAGQWQKIDYAQVCRDLDAQMNMELRTARERRLA